MCDYYNYYDTCDCTSDKINCVNLLSLHKCRFFYELIDEFPSFRLLYKLTSKLNIITKECILNMNNNNKIMRNIVFCCHLCGTLTNLHDKFIVMISMIEYILKNWNDDFRNREFLTELVEKLNIITKNNKILEEVLLKMYYCPVNDSIKVINSWIYILLDEISCSIY
jgi:hypothetical protein